MNPFSKRHYLFWGAVNLIPLAVAPALRSQFFLCGAAFLFASTIKGYLYGVALPHKLKAVLHPIIFCFLYSTGCMALWAYLTNMPYGEVLDMYMPQVCAPSAASCACTHMCLLGNVGHVALHAMLASRLFASCR